MRTRLPAVFLGLSSLCACSSDGGPAPAATGALPSGAPATPGEGVTPGTVGATPPFAVSQRPELQWKRSAALEADLSAALELAPEELCTELGAASCLRDVHLSALGGNDPFNQGMVEPSAEPLATTPTAVDRVVLSACASRAQLEASGKKPALIFAGLALEGRAPSPDSEAANALATRLFRRFLARAPEPAEAALVAGLALGSDGSAVSALAFAEAACFAVGTHTEFLFF